MPTGQITETIAVGGVNLSSQVTRTQTGQVSQEVPMPAGNAGTLTTRTDNDTGVATLSAGHGIITGDKVDVYWTGGVRYGMGATVSGNAVTIDLGAGDSLPAQDSAVVVTKRVEVNIDFEGDTVEMIATVSDRRGHIDFTTGADVSIDARELLANEAWTWVKGSGVTNPLAGQIIGKMQVSCGDSSNAATLKVGVLYDSTP